MSKLELKIDNYDGGGGGGDELTEEKQANSRISTFTLAQVQLNYGCGDWGNCWSGCGYTKTILECSSCWPTSRMVLELLMPRSHTNTVRGIDSAPHCRGSRDTLSITLLKAGTWRNPKKNVVAVTIVASNYIKLASFEWP